MSNEIFGIDYSSCDDLKREVQSYINYFEDIEELIGELESELSNATSLNAIWSKETINNNIFNLKNAIKKEITRYGDFKNQFYKFYSNIEDIDCNLESMLESRLQFIEDNKDYDVYITLLQFDQSDRAQNELYELLIDQGVPEEEAMKASILFSPETKKLIAELLKLDESEVEKAIKKIMDKAEKSPEELILIDILSLDKNSSKVDVLKQLDEMVAKDSISTWLTSKYVGKCINQYKLDIKSIEGQIKKLTKKLNNNKLSQTKVNKINGNIEHLTGIRNTRLSKLTKIKNTATTLGKWAGRVVVACQVAEISTEQYENYVKNGDELDNVLVASGIDIGGIIVSGIVGSKAVGALGSFVGPLGTVGGVVVGFIAGIAAGAFYNVIIDPILTDLYEDIIEPGIDCIGDKSNDLGDWWDTLCW